MKKLNRNLSVIGFRGKSCCCFVFRAPFSALLGPQESVRLAWDVPLPGLWAENFTALLWEAFVTNRTFADIGMLIRTQLYIRWLRGIDEFYCVCVCWGGGGGVHLCFMLQNQIKLKHLLYLTFLSHDRLFFSFVVIF